MGNKLISQLNLPKDLKALSVLLVDDDDFVLDCAEEILGNLGINNLARASNGVAALATLDSAAKPPQVIICDLDMPEMDGVELFRHLSERSFQGGLIVSSGSLLSINKTLDSLLKAHGLNYLGFLLKPLEQVALQAALLRYLSAKPKQTDAIKMLTAEEIRAGLEGDCLEVLFQPQVTSSKKVVGVECLARWRHPELGIIPPSAFISVAEENGLISDLTLQVFNKAMAHLGEWTRQGHNLRMAVNVSMDVLSRLDLPEELMGIAQQNNVNVSQVMLEVTESRLMGNFAKSLEIITRLRLKGFGLSVDDFGTGYSSMEKLRLLPFSELKVDRAFVFGASDDAAARGLLELSVKVGKALNMRIVAEGAETQKDWDLVFASGCDEVQGYFVAKPMPAQELFAWKTNWEAANA